MISANNNLMQTEEYMPSIIREGVFGATFKKDGESLFLRLELLTEANTKSWTQFRETTCRVANSYCRGILSNLVALAGKENYPEYEKVKEVTGFTEEEYTIFTKKAIELKKKTDDKIVEVLAANSTGSNHMSTYAGSDPSELNYIAYISKNPEFSVQNAESMIKECTLKNFINAYQDILITVGSDFSGNKHFNKDSFHNRGISRNPYWVFEEKYAGLSMLLHGFTGVVAAKYFPEKKFMGVIPVGSMQCIIKNHLLPGEGYANIYTDSDYKKIDITDLKVSKDSPEGSMNYITIAALKRIYLKQVSN